VREAPPEQPGRGEVGEQRSLGEDEKPGTEISQELVGLVQPGSFQEEQPVADASEAAASYLTANRCIVESHAEMVG
jgi:hypothetical protein